MTDPVWRFQQDLLKTASRISFSGKLRAIAERVCEKTLMELYLSGEDCEEKQGLMTSLRVESGTWKYEVRLVSDGKYGTIKEVGTGDSTESPRLKPVLVKVEPSIRTCLRDALKRALM